MRNLIVTHLFETTLRFEREKKAGLGLRRRILPVFWHPAAPPPAEIARLATRGALVPDTVFAWKKPIDIVYQI